MVTLDAMMQQVLIAWYVYQDGAQVWLLGQAPIMNGQAEVPLAAKIGGVVVAGTADRLLVTDEVVTVFDFKTTRRPPSNVEAIPTGTIRQMAAYVAALEAIYPGREVKAGVIYTQTPELFVIPAVTLAVHKDRLGDKQESFAPLRIE